MSQQLYTKKFMFFDCNRLTSIFYNIRNSIKCDVFEDNEFSTFSSNIIEVGVTWHYYSEEWGAQLTSQRGTDQ